MRQLFTCLLLLPLLGFGQLKPLAQAVEQARAKNSQKVNLIENLFTPNGTEKAATAAINSDKAIYKLTLNANALNRIRQERREYLEIAVPTDNGTVELALVPANIFAPGFTVKTSTPDSNFTFDPNKFLCYQGIVNGNSNSLVAVTIFGDKIMGMVSDSTGNRVLAHKQDKTALAAEYAFYDERTVMSEVRPFGCGTTDDVTSPTSNSVGSNDSVIKANSACVKYIGVYFETDNALYQYYDDSATELTAQMTFLFNQVAATYRNDNIYPLFSELHIWTSADPYTASSSSGKLDQFEAYWRTRGNGFPGQLAHLLVNGSQGFTAGGIASGAINSLADRQYAYSVTELNESKEFNLYPTYSRGVKVVAHELGHILGCHHTHWCGWSGGAIDNCASTEGGCQPGPEPANGGTIMSYCDHGGFSEFSLQNGFGPQPKSLIQTNVANADLAYTTNDGGLQSVTSGAWASGSTWICGLTPASRYEVSVSSGTVVQLNGSGRAKSLNIEGVLNLLTTNSILNINPDQP